MDLVVGVAEEGHLEGVGFGEDCDQCSLVCAEAFHCRSECVGITRSVTLRGHVRVIAERRHHWRPISLRLELSLRRELSLRSAPLLLLLRGTLLKVLRGALLKVLRRALLKVLRRSLLEVFVAVDHQEARSPDPDLEEGIRNLAAGAGHRIDCLEEDRRTCLVECSKH